MFGFLPDPKPEKELQLPFTAVLEPLEDGTFVARVPSLPGCAARGRTRKEALKNVEEAVRLHLEAASGALFDVVFEDPGQPTFNAINAFGSRIVAGGNRDGSAASASGDLGDWHIGLVTQLGAGVAKPMPEGEAELPDFSPQAYCLAAFGGSGTPRLYAGTSRDGCVYESLDGIRWELSASTGEARVHCLAEFKGRLYAGTSAGGKLFCGTGSHWSLVHRCAESAITALGTFKGDLYFGTYPGGEIHCSSDGAAWHQAHATGQTFVRAFAEFQGWFYAATSRGSGGQVLRSQDGHRWETVFESKDPNYFCLKVFHGALWLGTGNHGRLYRTIDGQRWSLATALEDEGIRDMALQGGRLYLATEGRGRIYRSQAADTPPAALFDIRIHGVGSHSAMVSWRTDRPADSRVHYGTGGHLSHSVRSGQPVVEHSLAISHLQSHTDYSLKLASRAPDGSQPGFSEELQFRTGGAEEVELSSPSHPDQGKWSKQGSALFSWKSADAVQRFHSCLDRFPDTLPEPGSPGVYTGSERNASFGDLAEGQWWFHVRCQDQAGNLGATAAHYPLRIDRSALPPRLSSPSHPQEGAWSRQARASFQWEAPEDPSGIVGYLVLLDRQPGTVPTQQSGLWLTEASYSVEMAEDGDWWFHVCSVDGAGNVGRDAAHYRLRLDRRAEAPQLSSSSHPEQLRWMAQPALALSWSEPQDLSGIAGYYYLLDQRPDTVPTAHSGVLTHTRAAAFSDRPDGIWYFHVVSVDNAGNVGTEAAHYALRVDCTAPPPQLSSATHPPGSWVAASQALVEIHPAEDLSGIAGFFWLLDKDPTSVPSQDKGNFTAERKLELSNLADGLWHLHVVAKDKAGNVGTEAAHYALRVDNEARAPRVGSTTHPQMEDWSRKRAAEMVWDTPEDLSGIAHYYWTLDQQADTLPGPLNGTRCTEPQARIEVPSDGIWWFHVSAQDRAGNLAREAGHHKLKIDTQSLPPRLLCPTHPYRNNWSNHSRPRFEWFEPEDGSGVVGYYWCIDRSEGTVPDPASATYTTERYAVLDLSGEPDGLWWFHVSSRDRAGNIGAEAAHWPIHLDTSALPPLLRSATHAQANAWSNNPNPIFEWDAPEDPSGIAGYFFLLNRNAGAVPNEANGTWTDEARAAFNALEDGVWHLHVTSKDRCGNVGTVAAHYTVRIDTQALPPTLTSPTHTEGAWTRNPAPTFAWTPPRDASGIVGYVYSLDREPSTVPSRELGQPTSASLISFPRLEDGNWWFHIVSVDAAGNVGRVAAHYGVCVDTVALPPRVGSSTHPEQGAWSRNNKPLLTWSPPAEPSGVAGYQWCLDQMPDTVPGAQAHTTAEHQAQVGPLSDGEWWFHITSKDGAGNVGLEATHYRLCICTLAPKPKVYSRSHPNPAEWGASMQPSFIWEDGDSLAGISGHYYLLDANANAPVLAGQSEYTTADQVTLPPQKDGVWTFALVAKDQAGNLSEPVRLTVKIESQPPQSYLEPLPPYLGQAGFELRWRGEDRVSGVAHYDVQVREGEADWRPWVQESPSLSAVYTGRDGMSYQFRVRATDRAGNAEPWPQKGPFAQTMVDLSPPEAVSNFEVKAGPGGSMLLSWEAAVDHGSGVAAYEVWRSLDASGEGECLTPQGGIPRVAYTDSGQGLTDGVEAWYYVVPIDKVGNRRKEGNPRVSCRCDRTALAPELSSPSHPDPQIWSRLTRADLRWEAPPDSSGMAGYFWSVDQNPGTVPGPGNGQYTERREILVEGLKDGRWMVHVSSKDKAGNLSATAGHYALNIDTSPPPAPVVRCSSQPNPEAWSSAQEAHFEWSVPADPSRIAGYYWCLDSVADTVPGPGNGNFGSETSALVRGLEDGIWWFHVCAKDGAGNLGLEAGHTRLQITHSAPPPRLGSTSHPKGAPSGRRDVHMQWAPPSYSEPIEGYHYCVDQDPRTVPDARNQRTTDTRITLQDLADGEWWFHIVSADPAGRTGTVADHYRLLIRSTCSLTGQVTKANGMLPLEAASLELLKDGKALTKAVTAKDGRYAMEELEPGDYALRLETGGLPAQLFEGIRLEGGALNLNLSAEVCVWPNPNPGLSPMRFMVLAREAGPVVVRVYKENGQGLVQLDAQATQPGFLTLPWDCSQAPAGTLLWQATSMAGGKVFKFPLRKLQIVRA